MFQVPTDTIEKASGLIVFDKVSRQRFPKAVDVNVCPDAIITYSTQDWMSPYQNTLTSRGHFRQTLALVVQQPLRIIDGLNKFDTFQALLKTWLPYFMPGFLGL